MAGNPTAVNIGIGFDMSVLKQSVAAARSEISSFVRDTKRAQTDLERFNQKKSVIDALFGAKEISPQLHAKMLQYYKDLYNIEQGHNRAAEAAKRHAKASGGGFLSRNLGQFGTGMLAGFGTAAIGSKVSDFLSSSVNIAVERQRVDMMLDALTSGTSSVGSLTGAIRELDRQSMLSYMEISKAAQTMLGFGVANELVMPSLKALSEISMGNAERFQSLSLAFGQVAASGKLAGQEILQMVNAGFNPLQEISRTTGRSMSDLRAAVSNGEISFSQVADAIISATEAGGRFYQMNETMMSTLGGRIAKFRSDLQIMQAELGQDLFPTIETILDMITGSKDQTKEFFNSFVMFSDAVGFFISGVSDLLAWMQKGSGGGQKGAELMLKHVEKMKAAADSLEKAGDVEKAKTVREDAARIEQRISGGIREEMMQSEIDKFFQRLKDREQNRKEEEEKRKKEAEFQAELKRDPEKAKLWREELDNKMTLERLNKDTSKIAKEIEEERKNALMTEREILIENLGLANKVFDQDQRNLALKVLADFDASQIRKQREEDQNKLIKLLEDSKTAAEKLQEQINFVNEAQKNGLISAIDAKKILDKLNDDANKKDRDEQERRRKQLQEFSMSIDKRADAIERVKDIILAVKEGFLDQQTANREAMEIARGLVSDADKVAMDNPRMMDLGQAKLASQKLAKQLQNEQKVIDKLTELNALATQLVQQNNNAPRLMKK